MRQWLPVQPVFQLEAAPTLPAEFRDDTQCLGQVVEFRPHAGDLGKPCPLLMLFNSNDFFGNVAEDDF